MDGWKAKLAASLVGMMTVCIAIGSARVGYAKTGNAATAFANYERAVEDHKSATQSSSYLSESIAVPLRVATFNETLAAHNAIEDGFNAATTEVAQISEQIVTTYLISIEDLKAADDSTLSPELRGLKAALNEAERELAEWTAALAKADKLRSDSDSSSQSNSSASNSSTTTTTNQNSNDGDDEVVEHESDGLQDDGLDHSGDSQGTPNPEGEARITHVSGNPFAGRPLLNPKAPVINPNPDGSSGSTAPSPFQAAPTISNPQGGFTDPSPEGGSLVKRLSGPAPAINLRAPLINPNPEESSSSTTGISPLLKGTSPTLINPRTPKANLNRSLGTQVQRTTNVN
jgi:hypothetical protein